MARLVVLTEGFTGTSFELKMEHTTVGRLEDNAFHIAEPSVSSHHCDIILRGNEILVKDLNSTNGTFINGEQTKEGVLKAGQILRLGQLEMRLEDGAAAPPPPRKPGQPDHTVLIPTGVKLNELDQGTRRVESPFAKKSNKLNKIFLWGGLGVGGLIIGVILYAIFTADTMK